MTEQPAELPRTQPPQPQPQTQTMFEAIGGEPTFRRLVARFYEGIAEDDVLGPLYPPDDLDGAQERLTLFLIQYWGGPRTYSEQRGHPRLRMRHAPFRIGEAERDAWLHRMRLALDDVALDPAHDEAFWTYLVWAADSMRNVPG